MQVKREHSAILLTFIKLPFVIKIFVFKLSIFERSLKTGFTELMTDTLITKAHCEPMAMAQVSLKVFTKLLQVFSSM